MKAQKSYIDFNGRLAIPAKVRQALKLKVGDEVSIKYNDSLKALLLPKLRDYIKEEKLC